MLFDFILQINQPFPFLSEYFFFSYGPIELYILPQATTN